jgi:hypothetical protein
MNVQHSLSMIYHPLAIHCCPTLLWMVLPSYGCRYLVGGGGGLALALLLGASGGYGVVVS